MEKVQIGTTPYTIFVNENDQRAQWLINERGMTQPEITDFWRRSVVSLKPKVVLDIGMNYGEILFSTEYESTTKIIGIEANEDLEPVIKKSISIHPNSGQIQTVFALASNEVLGQHTFFVSPSWTGTSSAVLNGDSRYYHRKSVPSVTVDSIINASNYKSENVLFKIDVEGYEEKVMQGMVNLLNEANHVMGCIEFASAAMKRAGSNLEEFLNWLSSFFSIYIYGGNNLLVKIDEPSLRKLQDFYQKDEFHTDIYLFSNKNQPEEMGYRVTLL